MKIAAFGDTHGCHERLVIPHDVDVTICSGDISNYGAEHEVINFLDWMAKCPGTKILVPGNHEWLIANGPEYAMDLCLQRNIHLLVNDYVRVSDYTIYGSPYTPTFGDWAFMEDDFILADMFGEIPPAHSDTPIDILVTHGPACGVLDETRGRNVGSLALYHAIEAIKPTLHIFGHIHPGHGITMSKTITGYTYMAANVSICNDRLEMVNPVSILHV